MGNHTVSYKTIAGWTEPGDEVKAIAVGSNSTSGNYTQLFGDLTVTITPAGANTAGARWTVDGGAEQVSGATVTGLSVGNHTVSYKTIAGWTEPGDEVKAIAVGSNSTSGNYTQLFGDLTVTITPAGANTAGARWTVDGGAEQVSGATVTGLSVGNHTVSYKTIAGWTEPGDEVKAIAVGSNSTSGNYTQLFGDLTVTITPAGANTAGARWTVDGGAEQVSGATVTGLSVGDHTVSYKTIAGWTEPGDEVKAIAVGSNSTSGNYTQLFGDLTVTITPAGANTAGARWTVDGGAEQVSGATVTGLSVGNHTVSYKTIAGWTEPGDEVKAIAVGSNSTSGNYTQLFGDLTVTITPAGANTAGARWTVDGGAEQVSGATVTGLSVGNHTVSYKTIAGWTKPGDEVVAIAEGANSTSGTYVQQVGSLQVTILPAGAVSAGAQWRVDGGDWQNSTATVGGLTLGSHTVNYKDVTGWDTPVDESVTITEGATTTTNGTYVQQGGIKVTILPPAAVTAGAQWNVNGGAWQNSEATVSGLSPGGYTVNFKAITGWDAPASAAVTVSAGLTNTFSRSYTQQTGSLQVTITPPAAVTAGAQWTVDGAGPYSSGQTVAGLSVGSHTVSYTTVSGWNKPADEGITINDGALTTTSGAYSQQVGSLQVTILPAGAVSAGAQWRVDGGAWQNSTATVGGLTLGSHTVNYKDVTGWDTPVDESVTITEGATTTTSGTYVQQGGIQVTLLPPAAVTAGAQWNVNGGAWQNSGATVSGLSPGGYTVNYKGVTGWDAPASEPVTVSAGATNSFSRSYIQQIGSLLVTITPAAAVSAGAQWRVDTGAWQNSGDTVTGVTVGSHTVNYKDVTGWNKPANEGVTINDGALTTTSGVYVQQVGSLQVTILPSGAVSAGAQWRVDGGDWQNSTATVGGLTLGSHTVNYKDVTGWDTPVDESVTITEGATTSTSGTYVQQGGIKVTILPPAAVTAGAQWNVNGGAWQNSEATVSGLSPGGYTVNFKAITGWDAPASAAVTVSAGLTNTFSRSYIQQTGSLRVTITPAAAVSAGAQWRVDGGAWQNSDATVTDLSVGSHTVSYNDITGWNKPGNEVVTINDDALTTTTGVYAQKVGALSVAILPAGAVSAGARWRVDGGPWQISGATVTDLTIGSHTVNFNTVTGWDSPADEIVTINEGATTSTSGTYIQHGAIQVTLGPQGAIDAGAQWNVNGGAWQNSGATVSGLSPGSHTVNYKPVTAWDPPTSESVTVSAGATNSFSRSYIQQTGSLRVTILPAAAITAGAQWRVDGGAWQSSGATVAGLPIGSHTINYSTVAGWDKPADEVVTINNGVLTTTSGTYIQQTGDLRVTILPAAAVSAGAQWRVDGGAWQGSGTTLTGIPVGSHTVSYNTVTDWNKPSDEIVTITDGGLTSTSGTYVQHTGSLQVTILPAGAVSAGAQWRVDGGAWQNSAATVSSLVVGSHTVNYKGISGWTTAPDEVVTITNQATTNTSGTYTQISFQTDKDTVNVSEGSTGTFQIRLSSVPSGTVNVTVQSIGPDGDITVQSGGSLSFTTSNWSTYQLVTLAAAQDLDVSNGTATIRASATGIQNKDVTATEQDDDTMSLVVAPTSLNVPENGSNTFAVNLSNQPDTSVTVTTVFTSGDVNISVSLGGSLTFMTSNWGTPQNVTLAAADDVDVADSITMFQVSTPSVTPVNVTATEADDDELSFIVSPLTVNIPEGSTAGFQVRLSNQPTGTFNATVARVGGDTDITVQSGATLAFGPGDWNINKTVTLAAAEDVDVSSDSATIRVSDSTIPDVDVTANEQDNDTLSFITTPSTLNVPEGATGVFQVRLSNQPSAPVSTTVAYLSGDTDITVQSGAALTFNASNWSTDQAVTLAAAADDDILNGQATIRVSATGVPISDVIANEVDNDTMTFILSTGTLDVPEGGTGTFQVRLSNQPAANVNVTVTRIGGDTDISVTGGASLTFTTSNWSANQTVTLTAAEDVDVANGQATIQVSAPGSSPVIPAQSVTATEQDNDTLNFITIPNAVDVPEGGTGQLTVRLSAQPSSPVNVTVSRFNGDSDITVTGGAALTFTSANWGTNQTVTLSAAQDVDVANGSATIRVSAAGVPAKDVTATEQDDDTLTFETSADSVDVPEGGTQTFQVKLSNQPSANVNVAVARIGGDTDITVTGGASLTFTSANWSVNQTVTLSAAQDVDVAKGSATIRVSATGVPNRDVTANEVEDDTLTFFKTPDTSTLELAEGETAQFQVRLSNEPSTDVIVTVARISGDTDITVQTGASLTFTSTNWQINQVVTIESAQDDDIEDDTATIRVSATGVPNMDVFVTATDDDELEFESTSKTHNRDRGGHDHVPGSFARQTLVQRQCDGCADQRGYRSHITNRSQPHLYSNKLEYGSGCSDRGRRR